jgi:hypothetical protein
MGPAAPGLSDDDLARVRAGYESFNRQDVEALLALLDDGIEFHLPRSVAFHDADNPLRLLDEGAL